jgi:hypothetical protein
MLKQAVDIKQRQSKTANGENSLIRYPIWVNDPTCRKGNLIISSSDVGICSVLDTGGIHKKDDGNGGRLGQRFVKITL